MKFGRELRREAHQPWVNKYIDYRALKDKIKLGKVQAPEFRQLLVQELEKVNKWSQFNSNRLNASVAALEKALDNSLSDESVKSELATFRKYLALNTLAVMKIVKKFNRRIKKRLDATEILQNHLPLAKEFLDSPDRLTLGSAPDLGPMLETLQKLRSQSPTKPAEKPLQVPELVCARCERPIYGEFVSYEGRLYHPQHLTVFSRWKLELLILLLAIVIAFLDKFQPFVWQAHQN